MQGAKAKLTLTLESMRVGKGREPAAAATAAPHPLSGSSLSQVAGQAGKGTQRHLVAVRVIFSPFPRAALKSMETETD